jgi:hypothetical protein
MMSFATGVGLMLDEMERLKDSTCLLELLAHYVELGKEDRDLWQDRLHAFDGLQGRDLSRLYGELIAHGWIEQNTGVTPVLEPNRFGACYRITSAGQRAFKQVKKELAERN